MVVKRVKITCPECEHSSYIKYGSYNSLKKYRCKRCGRQFEPDLEKKKNESTCVHCGSKMREDKESPTYVRLRCVNKKCRRTRKLYRGAAGIIHQLFEDVENNLKNAGENGQLKQDMDVPNDNDLVLCPTCGHTMFKFSENDFIVVYICGKFYHEQKANGGKKKGAHNHKKEFWKYSPYQLNEFLKRSIAQMGVGKDFTRSYYSLETIFHILDLFYKYEMKQSKIILKLKDEDGIIISPSALNGLIVAAGIYFEKVLEKYRLTFERKEWHIDELWVNVCGITVYVWIVYDTKKPITWHMAVTRSSEEALYAFQKAVGKAGFHPKRLISDRGKCYEKDFHQKLKDTGVEHIVVENFMSEITNNILERFNGTVRRGLKQLHGIKSIKALASYLMGFMAYYIFLRAHQGLGKEVVGKKVVYKRYGNPTPAQECMAIGQIRETVASLFK